MEKQITILVADNNNLMLESLRLLISGMDNVKLVGEVKNGEEAIAAVATLFPDIILMDINMSTVNGFEATRKILKQNPDAKIIGISMHTTISYAKKMFRLGAKGYVTKNATHQEITEAINTVAAGGKYIDKRLEGRF
jgi:DNA-binding NarL/FixJ family response regulator